MNILSIKFLIFFILLFCVYIITPRKHRWLVLLSGSVLFYYFADFRFLVLVLITVSSTYIGAKSLEKIAAQGRAGAKLIENRADKKVYKAGITRKRKRITALCLILNFGMLFAFKTAYIWNGVPLILPLGISFYTFQTTGYLIDVYREKEKAESNFFKYFLFAAYFPQLIQGPINRYKNLAGQLYEGGSPDFTRFRHGFERFLWGCFKKMVVSDRTAIFVNSVFGGDLSQTSGAMILLAGFMFNLQLYTDFSGGIDMAMGISEMLGIEMAENFKQPFLATSIAGYWRRWHISLGNWLRDYVFYSFAMSDGFLNFSRFCQKKFGDHLGKTLPAAVSSIITFLLVGIWHEVTLNYVFYGLWHGGIMALSAILQPVFKRIKSTLGIRTDCMSYRWFERARTFLLITFGEFLTVNPALSAVALCFLRPFTAFDFGGLYLNIWNQGLSVPDFFILGISVAIMIAVSMKREAGCRIREALDRQNVAFHALVVFGAIGVCICFGIYGPGYDASAFIYGGF